MYFDSKLIGEKVLEYQSVQTQEERDIILEELRPTFALLIDGVIKKYQLLRRNYINDDISAEGWEGILQTLGKWNPEEGTTFSFFTAVVKNKIFWLLRNHYMDTSIENTTFEEVDFDTAVQNELISTATSDTTSEYEIDDFVNKLKLSDLDTGKYFGEDSFITIKDMILQHDCKDEIRKTIQKQFRIPKKTVDALLQEIYIKFMER